MSDVQRDFRRYLTGRRAIAEVVAWYNDDGEQLHTMVPPTPAWVVSVIWGTALFALALSMGLFVRLLTT